MEPKWQPDYRGQDDFSVYLDGDFARETLQLDEEYRDSMNSLGEKILEDYSFLQKEPYRFGKNGMFVTSIHLGNNGKWIATTDSIDSDYIQYDPHNIDTAEETVVIQELFGRWVKSAEALLQGER
jgi:hypothetical protein